GLSVLTDREFFGGSSEDLKTARYFNFCPILRKDFMVDEYQVIEAKSLGADAILLIAAVLSKKEIEALASLAKSMGMEVLLEVHNKDELQSSLTAKVDMVGVNNRNLKTFETNVVTSKELAEEIPNDFLKISESGIDSPLVVRELKEYGFEGFLIGELFMKTTSPQKAARKFIADI
ncbi:MAG: indole-3-glycerol phosphate synthase TrpC, partial [Bacteroidota bacterium]